jgi:hypothetical protein
VENLTMPVDREEVLREARKFIVRHAPAEERLEGLSPEQMVRSMTPEQREQMRRLLDVPSAPDPHPRA